MSFSDKSHATLLSIDALLIPFLEATTREEEERHLTQLLIEHIEPVIKQVLRYKMRWYFSQKEGGYQDVEEAYHEIQLRLLQRLQNVKSHPLDNSVTNLRSYVATAARNGCDEYLRRKFPQRRNLKDKIRYCLTTRPELALWEEDGKGWRAGLKGWERQSPSSARIVDGQSKSELMETLPERLQRISGQSMALPELIVSIFQTLGFPLELDQLTAVVAKLQGIENTTLIPFEAGSNSLSERWASPQATPDVLIEYRQLLEQLWQEIGRLPRAQRVALLCNLKNPQGINVITLFPATQIATFEQIAEALEIPLEDFESLWKRLPLDDMSLAEYLGMTRQQVINLRRSARDRLLRRRKILEHEP